jgi:hypothetical protein
MKRFIILVLMLLLVFSVNLKAQTKQETIEWLQYYLNKYYAGSYDILTSMKFVEKKLPYLWESHQYTFNGDKLSVTTTNYERDTSGKQNVYRDITETINLKRVIKVEANIIKDPDPIFSSVSIVLVFKEPEYDINSKVKEYGYTTYDEKQKKDVTTIGYSMAYAITTRNEETVNSKTENRFVKAFSHLIELCGGKLIKDVF